MRPRPGIDLDVLEGLQMLWRWLDYGRKPLMRPIGGGRVLDLARRILQMELQPPNREGLRWWRCRRGVEQRLADSGIDPETGQLINPQRWQLAIDRAIGELQDRKARKQLWKAKRAAMILEARKQPALNQPLAYFCFDRGPTYDQRVMVNGTGLGRELDGEPSPTAASRSIELEVGSGRMSFGQNTATPSDWEIMTRREPPPSGPAHRPRRSSSYG